MGLLAPALAVYRLSEAKRRKVFRDHGIGNTQAENYCVHHVVAWDARQAAQARDIFEHVGIDVYNAVNLAPLPKAAHARLHTRIHYNTVNSDVTRTYATGRGRPAVEAALKAIKAKLLTTGTYP